MIILTYNFVIHSYIPYIFVPGIYVLNPLHMNTNGATYFKALSTYRNTDMYLCIVCSYLLHKYHIHTHDSSYTIQAAACNPEIMLVMTFYLGYFTL